jgi:hypothetical protein
MQDQPILIIQDKTTGERWEKLIVEETLLIGREATCGLALNDRQVSRRHALIYREGDRYLLRDAGSRNGTFLNNELVLAPQPLNDGDQIGIAARFRVTFVGSEVTAPLYRPGPARRGLYMEPTTRRVWVDGTELDPSLSSSQFDLLHMLLKREGEVCTRDEIIDSIYADAASEGITDQAIDALVRRLRERLAESGSIHSYIETVRGQGFRLKQP